MWSGLPVHLDFITLSRKHVTGGPEHVVGSLRMSHRRTGATVTGPRFDGDHSGLVKTGKLNPQKVNRRAESRDLEKKNIKQSVPRHPIQKCVLEFLKHVEGRSLFDSTWVPKSSFRKHQAIGLHIIWCSECFWHPKENVGDKKGPLDRFAGFQSFFKINMFQMYSIVAHIFSNICFKRHIFHDGMFFPTNARTQPWEKPCNSVCRRPNIAKPPCRMFLFFYRLRILDQGLVGPHYHKFANV